MGLVTLLLAMNAGAEIAQLDQFPEIGRVYSEDDDARKKKNKNRGLYFAPKDFHRNEGIPSWAEIEAALAGPTGADGDNHLPLHLKPVQHASVHNLRELAARHGRTHDFDAAFSILDDAAFYSESDEHFDASRKPCCRFTADEIREMVQKGFIEETQATPKGWVRYFSVKELTKRRRRVIAHTVSANVLPRRGTCALPTMKEKIKILFRGDYAVAFDFAQCFSAYVYSELIRPYFSFIGPDGRTYTLVRLAMGQKHSCDIAQLVLELVLKEISQRAGLDDSQTMGHIDNGMIVGTRTQVEHGIVALKSVCDELRITLNDRDSLVPQNRVDFTGLDMDFEKKTIAINAKTITKANVILDAIRKSQNNVSFRVLACAFGITMYAHTVLRLHGHAPAAKYYRLCRYMSDLAREAEENPEVWKSGTARFPDEERAEMIAWLTETISTGPVHALYQDSRPTKLVITDASAKGWAVTVVDPTTWVYDVVKGQFPAHLNKRLSTETEPWAIALAAPQLMAMNLVNERDNILVLTDHRSFFFAWPKGLSPNFSYNRVINELKSSGPPWSSAQMAFIPGAINVADEPSRDMPIARWKMEQLKDRYGRTADTGKWDFTTTPADPSLTTIVHPGSD
jgi:hypothetical protein